jgi:hypothetical protein
MAFVCQAAQHFRAIRVFEWFVCCDCAHTVSPAILLTRCTCRGCFRLPRHQRQYIRSGLTRKMSRGSPKKIAPVSFAEATSELVFNVEVNLCCGAVLGYLLAVQFHF